jgi:hypothetical protein
MRQNKTWCTKVTHENVHEKLDSIEVECYTSHLSDQTQLNSQHAVYIQDQSPLTSAVSDIDVSKPIKFVWLLMDNLRSS